MADASREADEQPPTKDELDPRCINCRHRVSSHEAPDYDVGIMGHGPCSDCDDCEEFR